MIQYCFKIINKNNKCIEIHSLKKYVSTFYNTSQFIDKKCPFLIFLYSKNLNSICLLITSKSKKIIEKINNIHSQLNKTTLIFITLSYS